MSCCSRLGSGLCWEQSSASTASLGGTAQPTSSLRLLLEPEQKGGGGGDDAHMAHMLLLCMVMAYCPPARAVAGHMDVKVELSGCALPAILHVSLCPMLARRSSTCVQRRGMSGVCSTCSIEGLSCRGPSARQPHVSHSRAWTRTSHVCRCPRSSAWARAAQSRPQPRPTASSSPTPACSSSPAPQSLVSSWPRGRCLTLHFCLNAGAGRWSCLLNCPSTPVPELQAHALTGSVCSQQPWQDMWQHAARVTVLEAATVIV